MHVSSRWFGAAIAAVCTAALLSNNQSAVAASRPTQRPVRALAPQRPVVPLLYVASYTGNDVFFYTGNQNSITYLNGSFNVPQGMYIAADGTVYVGDTGNDRILLYQEGQVNSFQTLSDSNAYPREITGTSNGTIYVGNVYDFNQPNNDGSVAVYPPGATSPASVITESDWAEVLGVATDGQGNLYVAFDKAVQAQGDIDEFIGGMGNPIDLHIENSSGNADGLEIDKAGDLIVCDSSSTNPAVYVFPPGKNKPSHVLMLPSGSYPLSTTLTPNNAFLFVSDVQFNVIWVYTYPGFKLVYTITNGLQNASPNGIALYPPAQPS